MSLARGDASEVYRMAADLAKVGARAVPALRLAMAEAGGVFANQWAENARETSGVHGKHYPNSIDSELVFSVTSIDVEVGPNSSKKQGGMGRGFEFGSRNQPPHLDGLRALDTVEGPMEALLAAVLAGTFVATPAANSAQLFSYTTQAGATRLATAAQIANWTRGSR